MPDTYFAGRVLTSTPVEGTQGVVSHLWHRMLTASNAITNTTTETAFSNGAVIFPANVMSAGTVLRVRAQGIVTAAAGADTLIVRARLGAVGGAAAVAAATAPVDVSVNDAFVLDFTITIRTAGAAGTFVAGGSVGIGTPATNAMRANFAASAIDTTTLRALTLTAQWSAAAAGDSCRLDLFTVDATW